MILCVFPPNAAAAEERIGNHFDSLFDRFDYSSLKVCLISVIKLAVSHNKRSTYSHKTKIINIMSLENPWTLFSCWICVYLCLG